MEQISKVKKVKEIVQKSNNRRRPARLNLTGINKPFGPASQIASLKLKNQLATLLPVANTYLKPGYLTNLNRPVEKPG
jgi:hypothetical protein